MTRVPTHQTINQFINQWMKDTKTITHQKDVDRQRRKKWRQILSQQLKVNGLWSTALEGYKTKVFPTSALYVSWLQVDPWTLIDEEQLYQPIYITLDMYIDLLLSYLGYATDDLEQEIDNRKMVRQYFVPYLKSIDMWDHVEQVTGNDGRTSRLYERRLLEQAFDPF